jgi:hypothetical protein
MVCRRICPMGGGILGELGSNTAVTTRGSNLGPESLSSSVFKQACTMFFSANAPRSFAARHSDLVRFVLNKESRQFPPDIDMCRALYRGPLARVTGATGKLEVATRSTEIVSEVAYPPFALRLISNSGPAGRLGSISHFSNYGFGNRADLSLTVVVGEGHTPYPGDYRTKEQVLSDTRKSRN